MDRRNFITLLGGAAAAGALPLVARAQQAGNPVIGFLSGRSAGEAQYLVTAVGEGLREAGFVAGQNLAVEYRWADGQYDRLPGQAGALVRRPVTLIIAAGAVQAIQAAKAATSTIPIVFVTGDDPVRLGLVASLNRPGGNITGISPVSQALEAKRLALLHELVPKTAAIAMLVYRGHPYVEAQLKEADTAARSLGRQLNLYNVTSAADIDAAFATLTQRGDGAFMVAADPFMNIHRERLVALALRHKIPSLFYSREYVVAGGLMSYGASLVDGYRQAGLYAGRILKGEKPGDLPVMQPTKFELVLNMKTAKALGLVVPDKLIALADEVIE
jgi:putative tryptophan/tyrosine transport system substrate-binding protein